MRPRFLAAALLFIAAAFGADVSITQTIKDMYTSTLNAMRVAKTKDDVQILVIGMDVPEWVGISPAGET